MDLLSGSLTAVQKLAIFFHMLILFLSQWDDAVMQRVGGEQTDPGGADTGERRSCRWCLMQIYVSFQKLRGLIQFQTCSQLLLLQMG
jgi:hypothetical protein